MKIKRLIMAVFSLSLIAQADQLADQAKDYSNENDAAIEIIDNPEDTIIAESPKADFKLELPTKRVHTIRHPAANDE